MVSSTNIANMALSHVGAKSNIESLNENSVEAMTCRLWYDHARLSTLEAHDWTFARKRLTLALDSEDPPTDWAYRYQYPGDCVKARQITSPYDYLSQTDTAPFIRELNSLGQNTILTDQPEAELRYTSNIVDTSSFTALFTNALTYSLATMIGYKLSGKANTVDRCFQLFQYSIDMAKMTDANEGRDRRPREAPWIVGRN